MFATDTKITYKNLKTLDNELETFRWNIIKEINNKLILEKTNRELYNKIFIIKI